VVVLRCATQQFTEDLGELGVPRRRASLSAHASTGLRRRMSVGRYGGEPGAAVAMLCGPYLQ